MAEEWGQHHHEGDHQGEHHEEFRHEEPERQESESVPEEDQVDQESDSDNDDDYIDRRSTRPRRAQYSRADVENILTFIRELESASDVKRDRALAVLGYSDEFDLIDVAFAVHPPGGTLFAFETYSDLAIKSLSGKLGFLDGMEFSTSLADSTVETIRSVTRVHNAFVSEDDQIRYRRNMAITDVVQSIVGGLEGLDQSEKENIEFIQTLLDVWPGR